ncbi:DNA primase [Streptomyces sp. ME02-6978.2a]|uniref:DNA primase n=1 Tax=Streptomyces sp. ME02-6978.2a TaxID=462922 RepID=UPI0029A85E83|nr:DNA primase [Streptomyces sp. ME02-6978.2a]MDX3359576.1 DNA primase [Streptomyces sp. ME02-6978.2a]
MNRTALGLAIGAGYVLGRTKKMKMAFAVGTLVAGKKMQLSPRAVADLVSQQLKSNPQFKEIGDQLRQDLRGVGKAASGALVERQISTLADRLHSRTGQLRDQASGVLPGTADDADDAGDGDEGDEGVEEDEDRGREEQESAEDRSKDRDEAPRRRPAKKAPARKAAKKAPAKRTGEGDGAAGGAGGAAKKTARTAKKAPARKTAAARGTARRATGGQSGEGRR